MSPNHGDAVLADSLPLLWVVNSEALLGGETEHTDLSLDLIAMDGARGLADLVEGVHP
jgi:hypothetical protein